MNPSGWVSVAIYTPSGQALETGNWELRLYIEGHLVQSATFTIITAASEPSFGPIAFSLEVVEDTNEPINPTTTFPAGTTVVVASWDYQGMAGDMYWTRAWYVDSVEIMSNTIRWDEYGHHQTGQGVTSGRITNYLDKSGELLPSGNYELQLYIGNRFMQSGTFSVQ